MLLTRQFPAEHCERAMESWAWLAIADKTPVMSSLFGDLFFVAEDGYWFLDTIEGTLDRQWRNRDDLQSSLASDEGLDEFLLGRLAEAAHRSGPILASNEVYDFAIPPILGGEFSVENLRTRDFVVSVHIAGQLIHQGRAGAGRNPRRRSWSDQSA
ncbi:MAG TPA: T6SS immunity protein Tdi1 domain-containing protein [Acidimicrobiia bacterium]|nr:T6SS immunity protein Tdi1 domain-containing protein [Acidimicrobiia bacterium]